MEYQRDLSRMPAAPLGRQDNRAKGPQMQWTDSQQATDLPRFRRPGSQSNVENKKASHRSAQNCRKRLVSEPTRANGAGGLKASTGSLKRDKNETNSLTLRRGLSACRMRLECGPAVIAGRCRRYFEDAARRNLHRQGCRRDRSGPGYAPACGSHNEQVHRSQTSRR